MKVSFRHGHAAQLSIIEFTGLEEKAPTRKRPRRKREEAAGHEGHQHAATA